MRPLRQLGLMLVLILAIVVAMKFWHPNDTTLQRPPAAAKASGPVAIRASSVPFVGCKSDGQTGPVAAPEGEGKVVLIDPKAAQQLAYYSSQKEFGVLAPRGWYCFGTYGSNGDTLYVSPQPINTANLFASNPPGFTGPAVQLSRDSGDTSGRFGVAKIIARVFPAHIGFARVVIREGIEPASSFPFGPYPNDKLTYRGNEIVEYQTPANTQGLGTDSSLHPSADPISGVAILVGETPDLLHLSVRLPAAQAALAPLIIRQVERDAPHRDKGASQLTAIKQTENPVTAPRTAKGYPVPEDTFVDAYIVANIGQEDLDQDQLAKLAHDEYKMGKQIDTQTLLAGGAPLDTRGKRAMDYLSYQSPQQHQAPVYKR